MIQALLVFAAILQAIAVGYGVVLLSRRRGATNAWLFLLGAMLSMLAWRLAVMANVPLPPFFNPAIAIWGSTCMLCAMFLFGREVALRQRAEAERDALLASERSARTEAERANRVKDEFLATLSHELRTPLAAILGWCAVMQRTRGSPRDVDRAIDTIERNARAQARLVDDLLDVTRIRAGTLHLELVPVALDQPVRAALQAVRPQADAKGLTLHLACEEAPLVQGDAGRLQQLAANLLVNAVKFTPAGGTVTLAVRATGDRAEFEVADDGEGIEADFLPQLFTRFRQQDGSQQRRHGGLGLGLAIAADLARLHGGTIAARSEGPGRGATFTVSLPLLQTGTAGAPAAANPAQGTDVSPRPLAGLRLVVIDDEADVRGAVAALLGQLGADVSCLDSGAELAGLLLSERPDLLIVDIGMPDEDGYALIRRIRQLPTAAGGATPAISLTAHAREEDRARALEAGFQRHLPKPVDPGGLAGAILDTLGPAADTAARRAG